MEIRWPGVFSAISALSNVRPRRPAGLLPAENRKVDRIDIDLKTGLPSSSRDRRRYPRIALSVITADPDSMAARLAHRELDLALLPYPIRQQSLGMVQLGRDELVAIVARGHRLSGYDRLHPKDLREQPLIVPNPGNKLWTAWDTFLIEAGVFPQINIETDDLDVARQSVIEGYGLSVAPRWSVLPEVERGQLCAITLGDAGVFRQWCLAYHHGLELAGARRNFLKICQEEMPRLLGASRVQRRVIGENPPGNQIPDTSKDEKDAAIAGSDSG